MPTLRLSLPAPVMARTAALSAMATVALLLLAANAPGRSAAAPLDETTVLVTAVNGPITPVIADHVAEGVRRAEEGGHAGHPVGDIVVR